MRRALALARRGRATVAPNPKVGAVVVAGDEIVGEGWHARAGAAHAESVALTAAGERAQGGILYVTLEPCAHFGRTPPCVDAILAAGVTRVVASHLDPDPRTAGRGFDRLRRAGVEVVVGLGADEAMELNLPFLMAKIAGRPAVTLKWAASLDGKIATRAGESRWITGPAARRRALELREENDAILIGSGTALADDPRLTRRLRRAGGPILRVVLDRRLRLPPAAALFGEAGPVLIYTETAAPGRCELLRRRGAEVVRLERVTAAAVVADLHERSVQSVLVEGGSTVAAAFFEAGLWDRVVLFLAPFLLGGVAAPSAVGGAGVGSLAERGELERVRIVRRGGDFELTGLRSGCLQGLSSNVGG